MLAMPLAKRAFTSSTRAASQAIRTTPSSLDKNLARSMAPPTKPSRSKPSLASNAVDKLNEHQSSAQVSSGSGLRQLKAGKVLGPELLFNLKTPV